MQLPAVLLLGRTNVGKSSLFNRLTGGHFAITDSSPHTTRDLHHRPVTWHHTQFTLTDSGGFDLSKPDELDSAVLEQVAKAIDTAAVVVLVVETNIGLLPEERQLLRKLLRDGKTVILTVNKVDKPSLRQDDAALKSFQFGGVPAVAVSAKNGGGTGDLLDAIAQHIPRTNSTAKTTKRTSIVLIGRTNVGKSALTNAILHDDVRVVSHQPHTTRDAQAYDLTYHGKSLTVVDTAGVRAKGRTATRVEALSLHHTLDALKEADIACLVFSVPDGIGLVEKTLAGKAVELGKSLIMVGNQWDRVPEKDPRSVIGAERQIRRILPFIQWAPFTFTSATAKHNVPRVLELALAARTEQLRTIPQAELDTILRRALRLRPGERRAKKIVSHLEQTGVEPPTFIMRTSKREALPTAYTHVVENALRDEFPFTGTPIRVRVEQPFAKSI